MRSSGLCSASHKALIKLFKSSDPRQRHSEEAKNRTSVGSPSWPRALTASAAHPPPPARSCRKVGKFRENARGAVKQKRALGRSARFAPLALLAGSFGFGPPSGSARALGSLVTVRLLLTYDVLGGVESALELYPYIFTVELFILYHTIVIVSLTMKNSL